MQNQGRTPFSALHEAFLKGELSPRQNIENTLEKIGAREPDLKAFAYLDFDLCRQAADESTARYRAGRPLSAFDGCPVGIKDIIETKDMPTGFGSPAFVGNLTHRDAACVQALRQNGAIPFGKTVTTEFAIGFSGQTVNPHDPRRTPGGSSSGSAAAVGAGLLPVALGTQTQGSVLRPASYTGTFGFKGTHGALPSGGIHPLSPTHDHLGLIANNLDDLWGTASLVSRIGNPGFAGLRGASNGSPEASKPRRIIRLHLKGWDEVEDANKPIVDEQFARLASQGVDIVDRDNDPRVRALEETLDRDIAVSLDMVAYEMRFPYHGYVERFGDVIGERIRGQLERAAGITSADYESFLSRRKAARRLVVQVLEGVKADAFAMPAASGPAPEGFTFTGSRTYLVYWSWLGFPSMSLPLMKADGMPWGLQLAHIAHADPELCATARWVWENRAS